MIGIGIETELVCRARRRERERAFKVGVDVSDHVRITVEDHVVAFSVGDVNILGALLFQVGRFQFHVVIVAVDAEDTFKQWLGSVVLQVDSGLAYWVPHAFPSPLQRPSLEDFVLMSWDSLLATDFAFGV